MTSRILTIHRILEGVPAKNQEAMILFVDFSNMGQTLLTFGLPKETVADIMTLYKNTMKTRDYFDIIVGVLQGDTLAPYFFIIRLGYVLRTSIHEMKDNGLKLTREKLKVPCTKNYWRGLRRWHSTSGKYVRPSRYPATEFGTRSYWHRPPCQRA